MKKKKVEKFATLKDLGKLKKNIVKEDAQQDKQMLHHPKKKKEHHKKGSK